MRNSFSEIRWLNCKNVSGQTIPPFSCVRVTDVNRDNGVLSVNQPNKNGQDVMITREGAIAPNGYGLCTMDWPVIAAYDSGDGTPAVGDDWGAAAGFWDLGKGTGFTGFGVIGGVDAHAETVIVYRNAGSGGDNISFIKCTSATASSGFYPGTLSEPTTSGWSDISTAVSFLPLNPQNSPTVTPQVGARYPATLISGTKYVLTGPIVKCDGQENLQVG